MGISLVRRCQMATACSALSIRSHLRGETPFFDRLMQGWRLFEFKFGRVQAHMTPNQVFRVKVCDLYGLPLSKSDQAHMTQKPVLLRVEVASWRLCELLSLGDSTNIVSLCSETSNTKLWKISVLLCINK
jgi:hypothetical protein